MKHFIRILSLLCTMMLLLGAVAEERATVTVEGVGEHVTVTLTMEDDRIKSVEASSDNTEADERGRKPCPSLLKPWLRITPSMWMQSRAQPAPATP